MREKLELSNLGFSSTRITPASAGKTKFLQNHFLTFGDHPRECGKNHDLVERSDIKLGSPPRVREKRSDEVEIIDTGRITPASAGKTLKDPIEIANPD